MVQFRPLTASDAPAVTDMMRVFYASPAVLTNGSDEIFARDIAACVSDDPGVWGYVFEADGAMAGYSMLSRGFSTEYGRPVVWIEDLYVAPDYRGQGIGSAFLAFMRHEAPEALLKLEVEAENTRAIEVYRRAGFETLDYHVMLAK